MLIKLIRNKAEGSAITGRLIVDGRFFCYTLERVGYQIPALFYHVQVTMSPRFKRLLPLVCGVPERSGIRIHRGSKPQHSTGCVLVLADNWRSVTATPQGRTSAEVEKELTNFLLQIQNDHEEIYLEVTDYRDGTELGYNTMCDTILQEHKRDARRAELRYLELHPEERKH